MDSPPLGSALQIWKETTKSVTPACFQRESSHIRHRFPIETLENDKLEHHAGKGEVHHINGIF